MKQDLLRFYFSFEGRATRSDFNIRFALVGFLGSIVAGILDFGIVNHGDLGIAMNGPEPFSDFWNILVLVSMLAVTCRRLHDMNYSGWWQLPVHAVSILCVVVLIATLGMAALLDPMVAGAGGFLGLLAILIFYLGFYIFISMKRGTVGPIKYGPDPLEVQYVGK